MDEKRLENYNILITRPLHQADNLAQLIRRQGGHPILFPTIVIKSLSYQQKFISSYYGQEAWMPAFAGMTTEVDLLIFTSKNAVIYSHEILKKYSQHSKVIKIVAIGDGTKRALEEHGFTIDFSSPPPFSSENLLQLPELQSCEQKKILIVTGKNSRPVLSETLKQRKAIVYQLEVYERVPPSYSPEVINQLFSQHKLNVVVTTSNESLKNLIAILPDRRQTIEDTPQVVISERGYQLAKELQIKHVYKTDGISDEAIMETIIKICKKKSIKPT
jgi:uroporphyrinogen-III synthase